MTCNDEEYILIIEKIWLRKLYFTMKFQYDSRPSNFIFKRVGINQGQAQFAAEETPYSGPKYLYAKKLYI
jgi:hypothetical protein